MLRQPITRTSIRACLKTHSPNEKEHSKPVIASGAKQSPALFEGLLRPFAPRNDGLRAILRRALRHTKDPLRSFVSFADDVLKRRR